MDWNVIKTEYVTSGDSIYKLAKDHGLAYTTVRRHCVNEGWEAERENFCKGLQTKVRQKKEDDEVEIAGLKARARKALYQRLADYAEDSEHEQDIADYRRLVQCYTDMTAAETTEAADDQLDKALAILGGVPSVID